MSRGTCALVIGTHLLVATAWAEAQSLTILQNDNYTSGAFTCNSSLGQEETLAARFTASPADYPYTIDRIQVLGCSSTEGFFTVEIWQDDADTLSPGPSIWTTGTAWALPAGVTFHEIILSAEASPPPLITSGTVRVALIDVLLGGFGFGVDSAVTPHRNFVRRSPTFAWEYAESSSVSGDWILRLAIFPAGPPDLTFVDGFESGDTSAWSASVP